MRATPFVAQTQRKRKEIRFAEEGQDVHIVEGERNRDLSSDSHYVVRMRAVAVSPSTFSVLAH